ncbi:tetratricopeptide repeat protein [Chryseobacterium sp. CH21]|uniref:tetratricopeptide repeat protein n=1 Tax=Chryseobacterium sp. CH21 TaxID=713556 RepID=UPI0013E93CD9|nr:tetratricopeptide repeat protein [Chryseobacterium sp. CH21]
MANDNDYFHDISSRLEFIQHSKSEIKKIKIHAEDKFKTTGDKKYLLGSKYIELFLYTDDRFRQLALVYDLLKLNDSQYEYITIACNFNLAFQFEDVSPKQAMYFLNNSIKINESVGKRYMLPHLYHLKGRLYYKNKKYDKALLYFKKALQKYDSSEVYFKASMYNNFGMTYCHLHNMKKAYEETMKGIQLLSEKKNLNQDQLDFLYLMRGNVGFYFYKMGNYEAAQKFLEQEFNYYKSKDKFFSPILLTCQRLSDLYTLSNVDKKKIIAYLTNVESSVKNVHDQIIINEILLKHYSANNELVQIKRISQRLVDLNHKFDNANIQNIKEISYILNDRVLKNINEKYSYELSNQKRKIYYAIIIICIICISSSMIF